MNNSFDIFSLVSEDFYTIFENMQEGVTVYRVLYDKNMKVTDLIIKYANPASTTSRVFLNKKFMGRSVTNLYGREAVARLIEEVNEISASGQIKKYETYSPLLDSYFSISAFLPAKNLYVTLTSDITEQKKAENYLQNAHDDLEVKIQARTKELLEALEEKEVLLNEIHHRVKNNLQMISSLINLQIPYITDENSVELFKDSQNRVRSIAMVHNKLYQSKSLDKIEFSDYIRNIMTNLLQTYAVDQNKIKNNLDLESINLNIETAIPCGLIITELVTNSIKHAFSDGREGKIDVELQIEDKKFILKITDNGIGLADDFNVENPESFGLQLVVLLVNQLRGSIELKNEKETEFLIKFEELKYKERV
ncbi:MAG: sensor histidine kinase [Methanobacterium sp.]|uniref:sensor histidine kinase n=1 Tax=Methanobacterium sp. TaxID=2164 RepID=UPI003D647929|nr:sensor histidine kinase [Methanobacterium sp.]